MYALVGAVILAALALRAAGQAGQAGGLEANAQQAVEHGSVPQLRTGAGDAGGLPERVADQ